MAEQQPTTLAQVVRAALQELELTSDADLVRRYVAERDAVAFETLVHRHGRMVLSVCRRVLRDRHAAEDAFQATFLQLARRAHSLKNPGAVAAWLHRAALWAALAAVKIRRSFEPLPTDVPGAWSPPDDAADAGDTTRLIDSELNRLPAWYRDVLVLCVLEGLTREDAARQLGVPTGTVDSRLDRAKALLRERLSRRGVTAGVLTGLIGGAVPERLAAATVRVALGPVSAVPLGVAAVAGRASVPSVSSLLASLAVIAAVSAFVGLTTTFGPSGVQQKGDAAPAAQGKASEAAPREIRPEGLTARVVFRKDLPVGASGVAFGPDGRLALGGWLEPGTKEVPTAPGRVWSGKTTDEPVDAGPPGPGPVAFRPDGTPVFLVLPSGERWSLLLWDGERNRQLAEIPLPGRGAAQVRAALSADGTLAAATVAAVDDRTGHTLVWKLPSGAGGAVQELHRWDTAATALAFSPSNELLAVGHTDGTVTVRSVTDGREVVTPVRTGHAAVLAVAFGRNFWVRLAPGTGPDHLLAAGGRGGHLGVWDLGTGSRVQSFAGSHYDVHAVAFSPDGATLASVGRNHPIVWDVATGRELIRMSGGEGPRDPFRNWMTGVAFSPDGRRLAITSVAKFTGSGSVDVLELTEAEAVRQFRGLSAPVEKAELSSDREWLVALGQNWQLAAWRPRTGRLERVFEVEPGVTADNAAVRFVGEGRVLFSAGSRAVLLDLASGRELASWRFPNTGLNDALAVRPDGRVLPFRRERAQPAWGAVRDTQVRRVYDLFPGEEPHERYTLSDMTGTVSFAAFSPDARLLVVGVGATKLLDGSTGQPVAFAPPPGEWFDGHFSASGTRLALVRRPRRGEVETAFLDPASGQVVATHPRHVNAVDDTNRVVIQDGVRGQNISRVGSAEISLDLDPGQLWAHGRLSGDGRFASWGRTDGTVCVADLHAIAPELFR